MSSETKVPTESDPELRTGGWPVLVAVVLIGVIVVGLAVAVIVVGVRRDDDAPSPAQPSPGASASVGMTSEAPITPEQEAIDAAKDTYLQYNLLRDGVYKNGGSGIEQLALVANGEALAGANSDARQLIEGKARQVGDIKIVTLTVDSVSLNSDSAKNIVPQVVLEACQDATSTYAVDSKGKNIRPPSAPMYYKWKIYVRNYPEQDGYNGWFIARDPGMAVTKC